MRTKIDRKKLLPSCIHQVSLALKEHKQGTALDLEHWTKFSKTTVRAALNKLSKDGYIRRGDRMPIGNSYSWHFVKPYELPDALPAEPNLWEFHYSIFHKLVSRKFIQR